MFDKTSIGFHTISIFKRLSSRDTAVKLLDIFGDVEGITTHKTKYNPNYYDVYYTGKDKGISWLIRFDEHKYLDKNGKERENKQYYIEAIINPKIIVGEDEYIVAANETYIEPMIDAYNRITMSISLDLPLFHHCILKEIHYCINFQLKELGYPYLTQQIMKLLKSGYIPPHYNELKYRCKKERRMKDFEHSFYLISKSVVVNCYDKQAQLIEFQNEKRKKDKNFDISSRIKEAEGIIRFEIQFKYSKIYNAIQDILKYFDMNFEHPCYISIIDILKILLSDAMFKKVLYNFFSRIIGLGDYHTLSVAKAKVLENCRSPKAERLIAVLEFINEKRGIHKAKAILDADVKAAKDSDDNEAFLIAKTKVESFRTSLTSLNELNINPMTLPLGISRNHKVSSIPNLLRSYLAIKDISETEIKTKIRFPDPVDYLTIDI